MTWLCNKIHEKEWSGKLLWKLESGSFEEGNAVISADYLYLLDLGSATYTEFSTKESRFEWCKFLMEHPEYENHYTGKCHSHNNMGVFHSGTDQTDLKEQLFEDHYEYYVSLIVNNKNEFDLRVAFISEVETPSVTYTYKTLLGKKESFKVPGKEPQKVVCYYKGDVTTTEIVDDVMLECYEKRFKAVIPTPPVLTTATPTVTKIASPDLWDYMELENPPVTPEQFLGKILPSFRLSVESMMEEMESNLAVDETNDIWNEYVDQINGSCDNCAIEFDSIEGQKLVKGIETFINNYNLIYPLTIELLTEIFKYYKNEEVVEWKKK